MVLIRVTIEVEIIGFQILVLYDMVVWHTNSNAK